MKTLCRYVKNNNPSCCITLIKKNKLLASRVCYRSWLYLALLICYPADAILSNKTSIIHGRYPEVSGTVYLLHPNGTPVRNGDILSLLDRPIQFTVSDKVGNVQLSDADGDVGLSAVVETRRNIPMIHWHHKDVGLSDDEKLLSFVAAKAEGKEYQVTLHTFLLASSTSGIPNQKWYRTSRTYSLQVSQTYIKNIVITNSRKNADGTETHDMEITVTDHYQKPIADQPVQIMTSNRSHIGEVGSNAASGYILNRDLNILTVKSGIKTDRSGKIRITVTNTLLGKSRVSASLNNGHHQSKELNFTGRLNKIHRNRITFLRPKLHSEELPSNRYHSPHIVDGEEWAKYLKDSGIRKFCAPGRIPTENEFKHLHDEFSPNVKQKIGWPVNQPYWVISSENGELKLYNLDSGTINNTPSKRAKALISCIE
ncbi:hypothetical protein CCS41_12025 [Candidatus Fukatsuia symbiotica]|uniref:Big-1 domain-containing protein n=1 Tax=Candidatus Fukatsuia symbiotica TaxID=1878942 RepID=A0A2U8I7G0_9GAMM|nr:DUF823 domain-containing adhesin [Candidatus Fukatsuia symbiotica]AWK15029.1 hypothetical protein CCS41_12025 [Candidatus Fukatsuia symbiotica]